uniref:Uncharacterized protein n=1 Tax=Strombidinopsis acuminata TaxID=141414 RepID=A0A7S3VXL4_9SPIT
MQTAEGDPCGEWPVDALGGWCVEEELRLPEWQAARESLSQLTRRHRYLELRCGAVEVELRWSIVPRRGLEGPLDIDIVNMSVDIAEATEAAEAATPAAAALATAELPWPKLPCCGAPVPSTIDGCCAVTCGCKAIFCMVCLDSYIKGEGGNVTFKGDMEPIKNVRASHVAHRHVARCMKKNDPYSAETYYIGTVMVHQY